MPTLSPEYILLALLLITPGFIATLIAISLGVVEKEVTDTELLGFSLVSSLIIDTVFIAIYQMAGGTVSTLSSTRTIFFTPQFRADLVLGLLTASVALGVVYAVGLTYDVPKQIRRRLWSRNAYSRHHRQPWEGGLENAHEVCVITSDRELVNGILSEYSRVGKERQLVLENPSWLNRSSGEMDNHGEHSVVLLEDDIQRLSIITTKNDKSDTN
ncbi:DUF6338 family protein [Halorarum halophilum]|uniref:DUF6338 family protein n=1 Tax=Halorarum halophilum TaxID=2743090 RepID=UPI0037437334